MKEGIKRNSLLRIMLLFSGTGGGLRPLSRILSGFLDEFADSLPCHLLEETHQMVRFGEVQAKGNLLDRQTGKQQVVLHDLPLHPKEALTFIEEICKQEKPSVLVGNSNGAFLAQIVASRLEIPALLGNPYLEMTRFLIERIGEHEYKSPRADGQQQLVIDQSLINKFAEVQAHQWDNSRPELSDRIWGLFGENDHLAHFEPLFLQHYTRAYHFPGGHTPTAEEVREYYVPLAEKLIQ